MSRSRPPRRATRETGRVPLTAPFETAVRCGLLILATALAACDEPVPVEVEEASVDQVLARERAAAHFSDDEMAKAIAVLGPLLEVEAPAVEDLIRAANVELARDDADAARPFVERALARAPEDPSVHWALYRLASYEGDREAEVRHVARAHELAPDDFPTELALANALADVGRVEEAERHYVALLAKGEEFGGSWLVTTLYRYYRLLQPLQERAEEAKRYLHEFERLTNAGLEPPGPNELARGTLGVVQPPRPGELLADDALRWDEQMGTVEGRLLAEAPFVRAGLSGVAPFPPAERGKTRAVRRDGLELPYLATMEPVPDRLLLWGVGGVHVAGRTGPGQWETRELLDESTTLARSFDLGRKGKDVGGGDGDADILAVTSGGLVLLEAQGGEEGAEEGAEPQPERWVRWRRPLLDRPPTDVIPVDFDHDGDLDLFAVGPGGVRLLRNDGAGTPGGSFQDATREAGLPADTGFAWCLAEDFDVDNDVDLLFGGGEGVLFLASNERGGVFSDATAGLPEEARGDGPLVAFDYFPDSRPDLALLGPAMPFFAGHWDGRFSRRTGGIGPQTPPSTGNVAVVDLMHTGRIAVVWPEGEAGLRSLNPDGETRESEELLGSGGRSPNAMAVLDADGDGTMDLVDADGGSLRTARIETTGRAVTLVLQGDKDNRDGIGAVVEVRSGPLYRRLFARGRPLSIGIGTREQLDTVRITWPNGVVQHELDLGAGTYLVKQKPGLVGSCPFLYTWNGETYEFISDVLGITPLGLPMAPGQLVPPDHDEYVLVAGEQLVPKDGAYEVQFTEELREVTYLDRIRLDVIDHPADTEVFPNERFTFPPFPEHHVHTVRGPLAARRATGSDGRDWTAELGRTDDTFAVPFEPFEGQFLGLTEPHFLELAFDPERTRDADKLRLVMTGWFFWTDASVNVAAARHPSIEFVPPLLQVPDGEGGWRTAGPPLGFPAGKLKTMVIDVTELVDREDPRLRVFSTLRLYWDSIRLAVDADDAPIEVTSIEAGAAELWERGFSQPIPTHGRHALDWFEWDQLSTEPRWNQHPGLYTRFGDVLPLLGTVDDRFVIMGSGDALAVRFDASGVPPVREGWRRDFLVFLDGWAKDRDPNTHEALFVEPLPFHGMSGYPYGPDESFPDTPEHRAWRAEWNTRPAKRWIRPLAPQGF